MGVEPLQYVDGVIDDEGQPGQAEEDPGGHKDAVPLRVAFVWVTVCKGNTPGKSTVNKVSETFIQIQQK